MELPSLPFVPYGTILEDQCSQLNVNINIHSQMHPNSQLYHPSSALSSYYHANANVMPNSSPYSYANMSASSYNSYPYSYHTSQEIPQTQLASQLPPQLPYTWMGTFAETLLSVEWEQCCKLNRLTFKESGIAFVYNPLEYAFETHADYVRKYCLSLKDVIFLGMNPGPFGMAQNGIPFGEVNIVRDWLKISGRVGKPTYEHPLRTIQGMNCTRSEVSGQRFWGLMSELCETPEIFFRYCFVHNYCPLTFMLDSGKNVTPPELKAPDKNPLFDICDDALCKIVHLLNPKLIVGIGKFAEERAARALSNGNIYGVRVASIMHPSPVNPAANKGWKEKVMQQLHELGIINYLSKP